MPPSPAISLSPRQRAALEAAIQTFAPHTGGKPQSISPDTVDAFLGMIGATTPAEQKDFLQLLDLLAGRLASLGWAGKAAPFAELSPERRIRLLRAWSHSRLKPMRKAFLTLKKLSLFVYYGHSGPAGNPSWEAIGYPGPLHLAPGPEDRLELLRPTSATTLDCDVVIVGSGAGGGIAAGILAEAGHSVIIVEKGPYLEGADFTGRELPTVRAAYDRQGAFVTADGGVGIFAGSCLGGGTTVNWAGSFPTPGYVLEEWHRNEGLDFALTTEYARHMEEVMASIQVNDDHSPHNPQNAALWRGSEALGHRVETIVRNVQGCQVDGCRSCGYCGFGCRQGHKQSTLSTWIRRAAAKGTRILAHATANRILVEQGKAVGVELSFQPPGPEQHAGARPTVTTSGPPPIPVTIRAKRVVIAAGSLHSPALLLRSGLDFPGVGMNLFFHPTVVVAGFYDNLMEPWYGAMMSAVNKQGMAKDGNYGYWIETPPVHPGMAALAFPWEGPFQHAGDMGRVRNLGAFIVLTRDRHGGEVRVDRHGNPIVHYRLHPYDRLHMFQGIQDAFHIHRAAGASEVVFPHLHYNRYKIRTSKMAPEAYLGRMRKWGWKPNQFMLFTAHQMGTCAMGSDPTRHPFKPNGESRHVSGLFIADGSALPTSAGVNPMVTIMALAGWVAKSMA